MKTGAHRIVGRILRSIANGPATVTELSVEFDLPRRVCSVGMWCLTKAGYAKSLVTIRQDINQQGGRRNLKLYEITPKGVDRLRKAYKAARRKA